MCTRVVEQQQRRSCRATEFQQGIETLRDFGVIVEIFQFQGPSQRIDDDQRRPFLLGELMQLGEEIRRGLVSKYSNRLSSASTEIPKVFSNFRAFVFQR